VITISKIIMNVSVGEIETIITALDTCQANNNCNSCIYREICGNLENLTVKQKLILKFEKPEKRKHSIMIFGQKVE